MRKIFCDGCAKAGIVNDLTDNPTGYATVDLETSARRLDLCFERCYKHYETFLKEQDVLASSSGKQFDEQQKFLVEQFWRGVKNKDGSTKAPDRRPQVNL